MPIALSYWLYQLISTLFLGRIGEAELGAALLGNMLANATGAPRPPDSPLTSLRPGLAVGLGLSMALDTLCSQAYGAQHYRLVGLHCQRYAVAWRDRGSSRFTSLCSGMAVLTVACIPILAVWSQTERVLMFVKVEPSVALLASHWV